MIIRQFLQWTATAPAEARAEGASALARAYVDREFDAAEEREALAVITALLDDPAPLVRRALALALAPSRRTPPALATAMAADRSDIAALMLEFSPVLSTTELVDAVAVGDEVVQTAVARRDGIGVGLAAAIAEVASAPACIELCRNPVADVPGSALGRMIARFPGEADLRGAIAERPDLTPALRHALVVATASSLSAFVAARGWLAPERAARTTHDAVEQACVTLAAVTFQDTGASGVTALVRHLQAAGSLTPALILRAVLCGNPAFFEAAVSELAGVPAQRVAGLVRSGRGLGFQSLYAKAGLPASLRPAFAAALQQADGDHGASDTLQRGRISLVLQACETPGAALGSVAAMLRRLDAQAARDEARSYARDVMREGSLLRLALPVAADDAPSLSTAA